MQQKKEERVLKLCFSNKTDPNDPAFNTIINMYQDSYRVDYTKTKIWISEENDPRLSKTDNFSRNTRCQTWTNEDLISWCNKIPDDSEEETNEAAIAKKKKKEEYRLRNLALAAKGVSTKRVGKKEKRKGERNE